MFNISDNLTTETITMYSDGAVATVTYQQIGWGMFTRYEVQIEYVEPEDDDGMVQTYTDRASFKKSDHAEEWAYDTVLEYRLNG